MKRINLVVKESYSDIRTAVSKLGWEVEFNIATRTAVFHTPDCNVKMKADAPLVIYKNTGKNGAWIKVKDNSKFLARLNQFISHYNKQEAYKESQRRLSRSKSRSAKPAVAKCQQHDNVI